MQKTNLTQTRTPAFITVLSILLVSVFISSGCASKGDKTESVRSSRFAPDEAAQRLFDRGEYMMTNGNFESAIRQFEQLETQYPLSKHTRQAQINLIYSHYKRGNKELAVDAANQFIKENPVHKKLDYVYYVLGLTHFDKQNNRVENLLRIDRNKRPQGDMQDALDYFQTLITKYPQSEYVTDAKQRMVFIRERLATHDLRVAQYYARRNIHIAASNRAKNILEKYPDTKAARHALNILESSYTKMGMPELAADIRRVKKANSFK